MLAAVTVNLDSMDQEGPMALPYKPEVERLSSLRRLPCLRKLP
ncbi:hypothetical protein sync_1444 [Synechococcus sp. CC9311]|nr:hypothetical protein sync_1444 [Synechococcus sp. CC9311]